MGSNGKKDSQKRPASSGWALLRDLSFLVFISGASAYFAMILMPGRSMKGTPPPLTEKEHQVRAVLEDHIEQLAGVIGERNLLHMGALNRSANYIEGKLLDSGYTVEWQPVEAGARICHNLAVEVEGRDPGSPLVIVGAHYDSVIGSPGANDNATGVAALLYLADVFREKAPQRTIRFVAFVNEEPPMFQGAQMGSLVYARRSRERGEKIAAMLSLETIGYYTEAPKSQKYPFPLAWLYPSTGNFIAVVGNVASSRLVREVVGHFRRLVSMPSEGVALPEAVPGVGWSDHWAFWQEGYPGIMITDTALYRYPYYHTHEDTPDKINLDRMTRMVAGLEEVLEALTSGKPD